MAGGVVLPPLVTQCSTNVPLMQGRTSGRYNIVVGGSAITTCGVVQRAFANPASGLVSGRASWRDHDG